MAKQLKPITGEGKKKERRFAVADIEVDNWVNFLCIGYYDLYAKEFVWFDDITKFFKHIFKHCSRHGITSIFCHFGGKFDFNFIIREAVLSKNYTVGAMIPRSSSILCFDLKQIIPDEEEKDWPTIAFRDSSALLPFALRTLTDTFDVPVKKGHIDYDKLGQYWKTKSGRKKVIDYLHDDCVSHALVLEKFYSQPLIQKAGIAFTTASQALKVYQTFMPKGSAISSLSDEVDEFVRKGYFGGRTEVFKPIFDAGYDVKKNSHKLPKKALDEIKKQKKHKKIRVFDANSLFPSVMKGKDYPTHFDRLVFGGKSYDPNGLGFWEITIKIPKDLFCPPLGLKYSINGNEKLIFPTGTIKGVWTVQEIEYAKTLGCKVLKFHQGAKFHNGGKIFDDFVNTLYNKRLEAKKKGDGASTMLYKLMLNSCYGKFGQVTKDKEQLVIDDGSIGLAPTEMEIEVGNGKIIRLARKKTDIYAFSNVAIAAYVTAYSRLFMHKFYMECGEEHLYYTDTDSIFVTKDFKEGDKLGEMKLEYTATSACFLLPKTYVAEGVEGEDFLDKNKKVAMKGFDRKKIQHFTFEDFRECLYGDAKRLRIIQTPKFATLRTALRKGEFVCMAFDPTTDEAAAHKKLDKVNADIVKYSIVLSQNNFAESEYPAMIKKLKQKKKALEKKLSEGFQESTRSIQSQYDKRICSPDGFFSKPIHIGG